MRNREATLATSLRTRISDLIRFAVRGRIPIPGAPHNGAAALFMKPRSTLMACNLILVTMCGTAQAAEKAPAPLSMTLSANVSVVRNDVTVRARVEPDARSRELLIEWVADDLSGGSHAIALEGARAARSHSFALKHLSPGQYVVTATLRLNDGTVTRKESNLWVVGVGETVEFSGNAVQVSAGGYLRPATQP